MVEYIILGIVQGLTEFFPVSSSAHLVIFQKLLGMRGEELAITVVMHLGTTLALVIFFLKDIRAVLRNPKLILLIITVTLVTGIIGLSGKNFFASLFSSVKLSAIGLMITGIVLILTRKFMDAKRNELGVKDAVILGITQGIAIVPGISRSGVTISTLLFRKIDRETSFRFSFLASIPAVFGAALLEAKDISALGSKVGFFQLLIGFVFSFLSGLLALSVLKSILDKARWHYFGYYCIILAVLVLILFKK